MSKFVFLSSASFWVCITISKTCQINTKEGIYRKMGILLW